MCSVGGPVNLDIDELRWIKYQCASCGKVDVPYDRRSGLGSEQISPGLAQACCLLRPATVLSRPMRR